MATTKTENIPHWDTKENRQMRAEQFNRIVKKCDSVSGKAEAIQDLLTMWDQCIAFSEGLRRGGDSLRQENTKLREEVQHLTQTIERLNAAETTTGTSITCPKCGFTSYNAYDIEFKYCGNCHAFI